MAKSYWLETRKEHNFTGLRIFKINSESTIAKAEVLGVVAVSEENEINSFVDSLSQGSIDFSDFEAVSELDEVSTDALKSRLESLKRDNKNIRAMLGKTAAFEEIAQIFAECNLDLLTNPEQPLNTGLYL